MCLTLLAHQEPIFYHSENLRSITAELLGEGLRAPHSQLLDPPLDNVIMDKFEPYQSFLYSQTISRALASLQLLLHH